MASSTKWNTILENSLIGQVVVALIDEGYRLEISDQDGGGLFIYAAPDGGDKPVEGYNYWVRVVPGNGIDVIVDYTTNLEDVIKPINQLANQFDS